MSSENTKDNTPAKTEITYRVTVTKIIRNFPFRNREYEQIGTEVDKDTGEEKNKYGYVYFDDTKDVEVVQYRQEVEELDMVRVINAVNKQAGEGK